MYVVKQFQAMRAISRDPALSSHKFSSASSPELRVKRPLNRDGELPLLRWTSPVKQPSDKLSLETRDNAADSALTSFVTEALSMTCYDSLSRAVAMASSIIPCAQHAHFLTCVGDEGGQEGSLALAISSGHSMGEVATSPAAISCPLMQGLIGWVARSGVSAVEADASLHLAYSKLHEAQLLGRSPVLCIPVGKRKVSQPATSTSAPVGVLVLTGRFGTHFSSLDLQIVRMLVELVLSRRRGRRLNEESLGEVEADPDIVIEELADQLHDLKQTKIDDDDEREELERQIRRTQEERSSSSAGSRPIPFPDSECL